MALYAFVQVYPVNHRFDKVISITSDKQLVDKIFQLMDSTEVFKRSFDRLDSKVIHDITENELKVVEEINQLIGSSLDWVDELIIQEVNYVQDSFET